jgi:hypothetical protein
VDHFTLISTYPRYNYDLKDRIDFMEGCMAFSWPPPDFFDEKDAQFKRPAVS